jgi:hypothetical protein
VKAAYNRTGPPPLGKRSLEETIQGVLKGQNHYTTACLLLMSEDSALTPLGSDKEEVAHYLLLEYYILYYVSIHRYTKLLLLFP